MSWIICDYQCRECGKLFESLELRPPRDEVPCCLDVPSADKVLSAVTGYCNGVTTTSSTSGQTEKPPDSMSTVKMADGQTRSEFKEERRKHWQNRDFNTDADNGLRERKVFV